MNIFNLSFGKDSMATLILVAEARLAEMKGGRE